jgi:TetR/AcrR family transcriptional regulator, Clp-modulated transcription factor
MTSAANAGGKRADAQRNRARILSVAEECFSESGLDVSMDAIAKRAGLGPGTLYRHFPTRDALVAALLESRHAELDLRRKAIEAGDGDSGEALQRWLETLGDWIRVYHGLPEPLRAAWMTPTSPLTPTCQGLIDTTDDFLRRAQQDGQAREGLSGRDLYLGALAVAWAGEAPTADRTTSDSLRTVLRHGWSAG